MLRCMSESCTAPPVLLCQEKATEPTEWEIYSFPGQVLAFPAHRSACGRFWHILKGGGESASLWGGAGRGGSSARQRCHLSGQEPLSGGSPTAGVLQKQSVKLWQIQSLQPSGRRETFNSPCPTVQSLTHGRIPTDFCEILSPTVFYEFTVLHQWTSS